MNETRNRADFIVDAFSLSFDGISIYDLESNSTGDDSVHYFPVLDDPPYSDSGR